MKKVGLLLRTILTSEYLSLAFRIYIGWLFIYASLTKIPDPAVFSQNVAAYQIVPYWGINLAAIFIPMLELITGFFLILGLRTKAAACILGALLFMYSLSSIAVILRGLSISCGCYDAVGDPVDWKKVMTDLLYLSMVVHVFFFDRIDLVREGRSVAKGVPPNKTFASE